MIINEKLTLLKIRNVSGSAGKKSGKPYSFDVISLLDNDGNVFELNAAPELKLNDFRDQKNVDVNVEIEIRQKGFDLAGRVISME